ncbi:MAG: acyl-CoA thioesterase [Archangiaceae bacterium]|nr:acyl-CoA thioesterase [Archangiaceae bacterium]
MSTTAAKRPKDSLTEMTQILLPGDANALGAAFGGSVMGWIDICAAVCAQRHARQTVVTASMDDLHFHAPIKVGMAVTLRARVIAAFTTSMEIGVTVHSENPVTGERQLTTSALLTFVALDKDGKKLAVPPLEFDTDEERAAADDARDRRTERLARKDRGARWLALVLQADRGR